MRIPRPKVDRQFLEKDAQLIAGSLLDEFVSGSEELTRVECVQLSCDSRGVPRCPKFGGDVAVRRQLPADLLDLRSSGITACLNAFHSPINAFRCFGLLEAVQLRLVARIGVMLTAGVGFSGVPLVLLLGVRDGGMRLRNGRTRDADCAGFNIGCPKRFRLFGGLISELIAVGPPTDSVDKLIFHGGFLPGLEVVRLCGFRPGWRGSLMRRGLASVVAYPTAGSHRSSLPASVMSEPSLRRHVRAGAAVLNFLQLAQRLIQVDAREQG